MRVKVEVLPWLSELLGASAGKRMTIEETLAEGASLRTLIERLSLRHEPLGRIIFDPRRQALTGHTELLLNGAHLPRADPLTAILHDGDVVTIVPPIGGG